MIHKDSKSTWLHLVWALGLCLFLSACGGGGDNTTTTPTSSGSSNWDQMTWDQGNWA